MSIPAPVASSRWLLAVAWGVLLPACSDDLPSQAERIAQMDSARSACSGVGTICAWAGTGESEGAFEGDGATKLRTTFYWPMDLSFAPDGRAYVLDWNNHRVRRVGPAAADKFQTVMGDDLIGDGPDPESNQTDLKAPGAAGTLVELNHPTDVDFLPDGSVIVAAWHNHKVRKLDPVTGLETVLIGRGPAPANMPNGDGGPASAGLLAQPKSVAVDAAGNIYVTDSRNQKVRLIDTAGNIATVVGAGIYGFGGDGGPCQNALLAMQRVDDNPEPGGNIALDGNGHLYIVDTFNDRVRMMDLNSHVIRTIAGNGTPAFAGDGGPATAASLNRPRDVEVGPDGRLYIADTNNQRVRVVDLTTGIITTVAGGGTSDPGDSGQAKDAVLHRPFGVAFDGAGNLYIADTFLNEIRKVVLK